MAIIKPLPAWAIINRFPAFYEGESLTAIEQTARVYEKINELITTYNKYVTEINGELTDLEKHTDESVACAVRTIIKLTDSYITEVDLRLNHQDRKLDENYKAFTDRMMETIEQMILQMKETGELDATILEALDNLNTKFEQTVISYQEKVDALKSDYDTTKAALATDYATARDGLMTQVNKFESTFREDMDAVKQHNQDTGVTLWARHTVTGSMGNIIAMGDVLGEQVADIDKYALVGVQLYPSFYVLCRVNKQGEGYRLEGIGSGNACFSFASEDGGAASLILPGAQITLSAEKTISDVKAGCFYIGGDGVRSDMVEPMRIDGLVLKSVRSEE